MHTSSKLACVVLLLALGVSFGFAWGTLTHVYFANHLGAPNGLLNQNEIYGAVLPDLFGYDFSIPGFTADYPLHTSGEMLMSMYGLAATPEGKAGFYGMFTHNNIPETTPTSISGADFYAHGVYPEPFHSPDPDGWVIHQGLLLVKNASISHYIIKLVGPEASQVFLPVVGHTLIETAVDILVRQHEDPLAGARLALAATNRTEDIPAILSLVVSSVPGSYDATTIQAVESAYRDQMIQYGQLYQLPEPKLIAEISKQTVGVAQMFITQVLGINPPPAINPSKIAEFIHLAINQVRHSYRAELMATLGKVEANMLNALPYPFSKQGTAHDALAEITREQPAEFSLEQNYPNPFNPTTSIAYAVPSDSRVTLKVYNSIGQEVATLVNDDMTAGRYVATWDAEGVASGTYFYRIQAGNTVMTKKMTLLR